MRIFQSILSFFQTLLDKLTGAQRLFLLIFTLTIVGILLTVWTSDNILSTVIVAVVSVILVWVVSPLWLPAGVGATRVRLASITALLLVAIPYPWWSVWLIETVRPHFPEKFQNIPLPDSSIPASVMIFVLVGIFIINYFMRDNTAMVIHSDPKGKSIGDEYFERDLLGIAESLKIDLDRIDRETRWSSQYFEPLDAEVEIKRSGKTRRKITKLLKAIKEDQQTKAFLVLGDPGSGKSVALRQLARELLKEVPKTGKIPVYLNLREWRVEQKWSKAAKPTVEQLQYFLLKQLQKDTFIGDFLNRKVDLNSNETMFSKLFKDGRFFLILDSFDEIPQVLDENEKSWLISELSNVIYRFLVVGHESRGVLASRLFRCPDINFNAETVLEVRPFSEAQIYSYLMERRSLYDEQTVKRLLVERANLVPAFRNPFTLGLVPLFSRCYPNQFPDNQNQLYETFLEDRLKSVEEEINQRNRNRDNLITQETIIDCAKDIAVVLFNNDNFGFEAPFRELIQVLCNEYGYKRDDIEDIIEILESARIVRKGYGIDKLFSFVHRRFAEYLVAKTLDKKSLDELPIESIPQDTRWREALVLYCEVTDKETATKIAEYCWERVKLMYVYSNKMNTPEFLESIHSLRFLTTAFRSRLDCIQSFQKKLAMLLLTIIDPSEEAKNIINLLSVKFSVEALGLLRTKDTADLILEAFNFNNDWIRETAMYACRSLPSLDDSLETKIKEYVFYIPNYTFISNKKELLFYFGLSDSFRSIYDFCRLRIIEIILYYTALFLLLVTDPISLFFLFFFVRFFMIQMAKTSSEYNSKITIFVNFFLLFQLSLNIIFDNSLTWSFFLNYQFLNIYFFWVCLIALLCTIFSFAIILYTSYFLMSSYLKGNIFSVIIFTFISIIYEYLKIFINSLIQAIGVTYNLFMTISLIFLFCFLLYNFIKFSIPFLQQYNYDRNKLNRLIKQSSDPYYVWTKEEISKQFMSLKTASGRLKFVEHLEEKRIKPLENSEWLNGNIPNINNDKASTLLAKLEERWLGLNR